MRVSGGVAGVSKSNGPSRGIAKLPRARDLPALGPKGPPKQMPNLDLVFGFAPPKNARGLGVFQNHTVDPGS